MRVRTILIGVLSAALALAAASWLWPNEERVVRHRLDDLAAALSLPATEPDIARVTRLAQLRQFLSPAVVVRTGTQEIASRDAVLAAASQMRAGGPVTVSFVDVQVTLHADHLSADVYLDVKMAGLDPRSGEPTMDAREVRLVMAKENENWVVTSAETQETLQHP
jgi:hypothetical protein